MVHLWDALPPARRGGHAPSSRELAPVLVDALRPGDKVMVKGSLGSAMKVIVDEILARQGKSLHGEASGQDGDIR